MVSKSRKIITIDPSYRNFAMAKIERFGKYDYKVLEFSRPSKNMAMLGRKSGKGVIEQRVEGAHALCRFINHTLDAWLDCLDIVAELPGGSQSARAAVCVGVVLGVLSSVRDHEILFVRPIDVKKAINKQMEVDGMKAEGKYPSKHEIIKWAKNRHPEAPWTGKIKFDEHYADAIGVCYAWDDLGRVPLMTSWGAN